ncbi:death domain-containing protein CRADD-like [Saccostrea cucullata]|uniref:death domain-containing protein CRADD-like n=1 Tax=Saccostrea cuccullata TaxID=36930 RepID=UPI002ED24319
MEHRHREAIRKNWTFLLENLIVDELMDFLISHSILTENMKEEVEIQRTRREKATQLLFIVQKRGPQAFQTLVDGLKECQMGFIAERLEQAV